MRVMNTSELLDTKYKRDVVDQYGSKIMRSGYTRVQAIIILVNGIKCYEGKRRRRIKEGRSLTSTAKQSRSKRYRNKLLGRANWF